MPGGLARKALGALSDATAAVGAGLVAGSGAPGVAQAGLRDYANRRSAMAQQEQLMGALQGIDPTTPDGLNQAMRVMLQQGRPDMAIALSKMGTQGLKQFSTVSTGGGGYDVLDPQGNVIRSSPGTQQPRAGVWAQDPDGNVVRVTEAEAQSGDYTRPPSSPLVSIGDPSAEAMREGKAAREPITGEVIPTPTDTMRTRFGAAQALTWNVEEMRSQIGAVSALPIEEAAKASLPVVGSMIEDPDLAAYDSWRSATAEDLVRMKTGAQANEDERKTTYKRIPAPKDWIANPEAAARRWNVLAKESINAYVREVPYELRSRVRESLFDALIYEVDGGGGGDAPALPSDASSWLDANHPGWEMVGEENGSPVVRLPDGSEQVLEAE